MSRLKIEINDGILDLFEGTDNSFYITKQLNDLHNLQNRQADFTRQIDIPRTPNNEGLLGLDTNEPLSNKSIPCNILLNETLVVPYASLIITNHSAASISIAMLSGNYELFDNIPNKSIKDLDFSSYSFPWTFAGINGIQTNTEGCTSINTQFLDTESLDNGTGVIQNFVNNTDIKNYGFAFYYKTLVKEIIEQSGYVFDDSLMVSDDQYNDIFIACPVTLKNTEDLVATIVNRASNYVYDTSILLGVPDRISFNLVSGTAWDSPNSQFIIPTTGTWIITFDFVISNDNGSNQGPAEVEILNNASNVELREFFAVSNQRNVMTQTILANAGDLIYIEVTGNIKNAAQYDTITIQTGATFTIQEDSPDPTGSVDVSNWIPDMNQRQALLDFLKLFNAFIDADPFNRKARLLKWNDYILETPQDLTNNIDARQEIVNEVSMNGYYRQSIMSYNTDSDVERTDTEKEVSFENDDSLPLRGDILNISASPSDSDGSRLFIGSSSFTFSNLSNFTIAVSNVFTFGQDEVFHVGDYIRFSGGATSLEDRIDRIRFVTGKRGGQFFDAYTIARTNVDVELITISTNNLLPRIGMINRGNGVLTPFFTINGYTSANSQTTLNVNSTYFNLQMNKIYTDYYKQLFDALQTPKIVNVWMNFSVDEFIDLDMLKPVFIADLNGYFYINRISQFKLNAPCQVELIRINKLI